MTSYLDGIALKKKFGQHFLRDTTFIQMMLEAVSLNAQSNVLEIGCGDGVLTRAILAQQLARLWVFEIDPDWVHYVQQTIPDERLQVFNENILDLDLHRLQEQGQWTLLANLPYQITFPILYMCMRHHTLFKEGVIMVQEEVAQKIVQKGGRGFGFPSIYLQYHAEWKLLHKVPPQAFFPPPKVHSRLLYFKPKAELLPIIHEEQFWKFVKQCFHQPRRTFKNNLEQTQYDYSRLSEQTLQLRAQQMSFGDLYEIWHCLIDKE
ncbi:MAG: 16S rRNA (adenine(1518)-N(6)/adenine(1519)-N(6))-dimethyltransferase RsmA [Candidatus Babeliales bacterium]